MTTIVVAEGGAAYIRYTKTMYKEMHAQTHTYTRLQEVLSAPSVSFPWEIRVFV